MVVLQGPGGTMALVPVYIDGQGPYSFALDTGASHSVIDVRLAEKLGLQEDGPAVEMTGVVAASEAMPVVVSQWRVGDIRLPAHHLAALNLSELDRKTGIHGLLGSDILSRFGVITVDYQRQLLEFRPKQ
jgi:predicted aspartyl protease